MGGNPVQKLRIKFGPVPGSNVADENSWSFQIIISIKMSSISVPLQEGTQFPSDPARESNKAA